MPGAPLELHEREEIRRTVKDAALGALVDRRGRPAKERNWELQAARRKVEQLTEPVKAQAIELALLRGNVGWACRAKLIAGTTAPRLGRL